MQVIHSTICRTFPSTLFIMGKCLNNNYKKQNKQFKNPVFFSFKTAKMYINKILLDVLAVYTSLYLTHFIFTMWYYFIKAQLFRPALHYTSESANSLQRFRNQVESLQYGKRYRNSSVCVKGCNVLCTSAVDPHPHTQVAGHTHDSLSLSLILTLFQS